VVQGEDTYSSWAKTLIEGAAEMSETIAYRRGALSAWEVNFDDLDALHLIRPYLDPASPKMIADSGIGVLGWSIWAIGEHLEGGNSAELHEQLLRAVSELVESWACQGIGSTCESIPALTGRNHASRLFV
jgi:hypothetical protein